MKLVLLNVFFLLNVGATFSQDVLQEVTNVSAECGNERVGFDAGLCIRTALYESFKPQSEVEIIESLKTLLACLKPFENLVITCEKDNYITLLETLRVLTQNDGELFKSIGQFGPIGNQFPCTEEESKKNAEIYKTCMNTKEIRDMKVKGKPYFAGFCDVASGLKACIEQVYAAASEEECPKDHWQANLALNAFSKIENEAENSSAVTRCFTPHEFE